MNDKHLFFILLTIMIVGIIGLTLYGVLEILDGKEYCVKNSKQYSFQLFGGGHFCDGEKIGKYADGWDFVKNKAELREILHGEYELNLSNFSWKK